MSVAEVTELPEITLDPDDPALVCHVYDGLSEYIAKCGIHINNDEHLQMHISHGWTGWRSAKGHTECPRCGAPICAACRKVWGR